MKLQDCVNCYNGIKFDGMSPKDLRKKMRGYVEDQLNVLTNHFSDSEEHSDSLELNVNGGSFLHDNTENERLTVSYIMSNLAKSPFQYDWRREFWRRLEDIYHFRNRLLNAIEFYNNRIEYQWPDFISLIRDNEQSDGGVCISSIERNIARDRHLLSKAKNTLMEHDTKQFLPYSQDQLQEIANAFKDGTLSFQHHHEGIHVNKNN